MTITASATDPTLLFDSERGYEPSAGTAVSYTVPVRGRGFRLAVELREDTWTVADRESGIFGAGNSPSAAWLDFRAALLEHLDVLERQEQLSAVLLDQLQYLRTHLKA